MASFILVCYDVTDTRRRTKVSLAMEDYGRRVQYSVFECILDAARLEALVERIHPLIDAELDTVRFYQLCDADVRKIRLIGRGDVTRREAYAIV